MERNRNERQHSLHVNCPLPTDAVIALFTTFTLNPWSWLITLASINTMPFLQQWYRRLPVMACYLHAVRQLQQRRAVARRWLLHVMATSGSASLAAMTSTSSACGHFWPHVLFCSFFYYAATASGLVVSMSFPVSGQLPYVQPTCGSSCL